MKTIKTYTRFSFINLGLFIMVFACSSNTQNKPEQIDKAGISGKKSSI